MTGTIWNIYIDYYREMWVFPSGSVVKNPLAVQETGAAGSILESGRFPDARRRK